MEESASANTSPARLRGLAVLFVAYVAAGALGERLALIQLAAIFWPPVGVLLAALLLTPARRWWQCLLVGGCAELTWNVMLWHNPLQYAAVYYAGNAAEVLVAAGLIRLFHDGPFRLESLREFGLFLLAAASAPGVSASVIATTNAAIGKSPFADTWWHVWLGDASGLLVATPLVLVAHDAWTRGGGLPRASLLEIGATALGVVMVTLFALRAHLPAVYAALPLVLWAAFRFHLRGAAIAVGLLTAVTAAMTPASTPGLSPGEIHERALMLQSVLGVAAILGVLVAMLSLERLRAQRELERLNAQLEALVDERTAALHARERELRAALAVASDVDRRKDAFLAMLGHELRNPLAPIRNATEWLARSAGGVPEVSRVLPMMQRQVRQLARLVDDLLDVARITQDRLHLQCGPVEIGAVLDEAVEAVQPLIGERRQRLVVVRPPAPAYVLGDGGRLAQCVGNLLTNSSKYSDACARIELRASASDAELEIVVHDDGNGIAADLLPHVFDPFVQGPRTVDRSLGGLGIGLSLVKRIVELHGGSVTAESEGAGRGARFTVRLPRLAADADGLTPPAAA